MLNAGKLKNLFIGENRVMGRSASRRENKLRQYLRQLALTTVHLVNYFLEQIETETEISYLVETEKIRFRNAIEIADAVQIKIRRLGENDMK